MKKLTATILTTFAILLGSAGVSESADLQKGLDAYDSGDYATALREWKPLAEQGNAVAQNKLGMMYRLRQGVSEDYKTSIKYWHQLATEQGSAIAMLNMGWLYQQGKGVPKNNKIAEKWWTLAAKQGLNNALFYKWLLKVLGSGKIQEKVFARLFHNVSESRGIGIYDNALYWYLLAAEQGHADAQTGLGVMYRKGLGVTQSYKTALYWYLLAAEQGHADAQADLAVMYDEGLGVTQSYETATKFYALAAEQGDVDAQINLSIIYYRERTVPLDYAYMWADIAALSGNKSAVKLRGILAEEMGPARIEDAQKLVRECVRKQYKGC